MTYNNMMHIIVDAFEEVQVKELVFSCMEIFVETIEGLFRKVAIGYYMKISSMANVEPTR